MITSEQKERTKELHKIWLAANKERCAATKKAWIANNIDRELSNRKAYYQSHKKKISDDRKIYHVKNKEKLAAYSKAWIAANPDKVKAGVIKRKTDNPERFRARQYVKRAIKNGLLLAQPCWTCGTTETIHAHHFDYDTPLSVTWLCALHHSQLHADLTNETRYVK